MVFIFLLFTRGINKCRKGKRWLAQGKQNSFRSFIRIIYVAGYVIHFHKLTAVSHLILHAHRCMGVKVLYIPLGARCCGSVPQWHFALRLSSQTVGELWLLGGCSHIHLQHAAWPGPCPKARPRHLHSSHKEQREARWHEEQEASAVPLCPPRGSDSTGVLGPWGGLNAEMPLTALVFNFKLIQVEVSCITLN